MSIELSSDLRQALAAQGTPLRMVDTNTGTAYVIVDEDIYQQLQTLLGNDLSETYRAQIESVMRAGWDDPVMDEYNDYDLNRKS